MAIPITRNNVQKLKNQRFPTFGFEKHDRRFSCFLFTWVVALLITRTTDWTQKYQRHWNNHQISMNRFKHNQPSDVLSTYRIFRWDCATSSKCIQNDWKNTVDVVIHTSISFLWIENQSGRVAAYQSARVPECQGARMQGATVPKCQGGKVPGCQNDRAPMCQGLIEKHNKS